jgi:hypothetical protein
MARGRLSWREPEGGREGGQAGGSERASALCSFDGLSTDVEQYFEELGFQYSPTSSRQPRGVSTKPCVPLRCLACAGCAEVRAPLLGPRDSTTAVVYCAGRHRALWMHVGRMLKR